MTTPPSPFIHLGLPKTATTAIRFNLFAQHSQIHYLGKFLGGGFSATIRPVILERWVVKTKDFEPDDMRRKSIREQLIYTRKNSLTPVLSSESLSGGVRWKKHLQAQRLKNHFGDCQIILFIREPSSFLKSFYAQMLRNFQEDPLKRRPGWMKSLGSPPHHFTINEWLDAAWHSFHSPRNYISYADTAKTYARVFGKESVEIFIFEEFVRDPKTFITKLCNHMGIDPQEGFDLMDGKRSNERLTTHYIARIQEMEQSPDLTKQFRLASREERRTLLEPADRAGEKIDPQLSAKWLEKINAFGDKQNHCLVKEWGLPLTDYGYRI